MCIKPGFSVKTVVFFTLAFALAAYANSFTNSYTLQPYYSLYPDVFAMYTLQSADKSLFRNDFAVLAENNACYPINNYVYHAVYGFLLRFCQLPAAIKVISLLLCLMSVYLIYKIGECLLGSKDYAIFVSGLFLLYFLSMDSFYGGYGRTFGVCIFCLFYYFLVTERFVCLPVCAVLLTLFYNGILSSIMLACIAVFFICYRKIRIKKGVVLYVLLFIFFVLLSFFIFYRDIFFKNVFANLSYLGNYKYTQGVSVPVNPRNPADILLYFVLNLNEHSRLYIYFTLFLLAMSLVLTAIKKKEALRLPEPVLLMVVIPLVSFLLIYPFNPVLASRQLVFSIPVFIVFYLSINLFRLVKERISLPYLLIPAALTFAVLHPRFNDISDYSMYRTVYDYVEKLPKNTLIAGYPQSLLLETVPFFSKRTAFLIDYFQDQVLLIGADYDELHEKRRSLIKALYSGSLNELGDFISESGVEYFLVEAYTYEPFFLEILKNSLSPEDQETYGLIKDKAVDNTFALLEFSRSNYDFKAMINGSEVFVVYAGKIKAKN